MSGPSADSIRRAGETKKRGLGHVQRVLQQLGMERDIVVDKKLRRSGF